VRGRLGCEEIQRREGELKAGLEETVAGYRDALTVKRVFGEPYQKNGVTVIPAAAVVGGGGGGQGENPEGSSVSRGSGTGFGLAARPAGAYVIRGEDVKWQPAIDVNRIISGLFALAALKLLVGGRRKR
jgi:uncharacterized spore protein YtfJ